MKKKSSRGKAGAGFRRRTAKAGSRTNAQWSAETTNRLLEFASDEFSRNGYDGASVDRIAERAGLTKGAVYYHFDRKPGLFRAVFERAERELVERIEARALAASDPLLGLIEGCEVFIDVVLDPSLARIILLDAPRVLGIAVWREIDAEYGLKSLREGIAACVAEGRLREVDTDALALLLSGAMNEAVLALTEVPSGSASRTAIQETLRKLILGLAPKQAV